MLEHLFGSKTRINLINLFLRYPDEPLFVREITRRLDTQINAVRRELANLSRLGLIVEKLDQTGAGDQPGQRSGAKKKYYQMNRACPLYPEIAALMIKAKVMLERRLDDEIVRLGDLRYLAFLGLFMNGRSAPVDLFMIGQVDEPALKRLLRETEKELGCDINFSLMSLDEYRYRKDITDRFLYSILEAPKNVVIDRLNERL